MKISRPPGTLLLPLPVAMVSCDAPGYHPNITTVAWIGIVGAAPPLLSICLRPDRHSYSLISQSREFIVNIPSETQLTAIDYCGTTSGREVDKFLATGLTAAPAAKVHAPLIAQCPLHLECVVREVLKLGTHHTFIGEIVHIQIDQHVLSPQNEIDFRLLRPVTLNGAEYWGLGASKLQDYGFTRT